MMTSVVMSRSCARYTLGDATVVQDTAEMSVYTAVIPARTTCGACASYALAESSPSFQVATSTFGPSPS
jgi:hypothetical protein